MPFMNKYRGILLAIAALTAACKPSESSRNDMVAPPAANDINIVEALPIPDPALDRAAFLQAVAAAASAQTSGADDQAAQSALDGRRFAIRVRFGCDGPAADSKAPLRWAADPDEKSFEAVAKPELSLADEPLISIPDQTIEAVEGFWIPRPWETTGACPAVAAGKGETALPESKLVGIAQYFTSDDSRVGRRSGRPYVATQKITSPAELPKSGLIMLLEGRFEAWPWGDVIRCVGAGRSQRPACVASAHLDRVAFLRPEDDRVIAEWRE